MLVKLCRVLVVVGMVLSMCGVSLAGEPAATEERLARLLVRLPEGLRERFTARINEGKSNGEEMVEAFERTNEGQWEALAFLYANMPLSDLLTLKGAFLATNVALAFEAREKTAWASDVPEEIFRNDVLPYANLNERRDDWRKDFFDRFFPLVKDAKNSGEAAEILNREIFKTLNVSYHATKRPKPDQSPYESIEAGFASCTGLSILLVDACRAVGVPARVVGTPMWADGSGNHTWVEVWDGRWRFVGAAEAGPLDQGWFTGQAAKAVADDPEHAIYAASFARTGTAFRMVWLPENKDYYAVDVTRWYGPRRVLEATLPRPASATAVEYEFWVREQGRLVARSVGESARFNLACDVEYGVSARRTGTGNLGALHSSVVVPCDRDASVELVTTKSGPIPQFEYWLSEHTSMRRPLRSQAFAHVALTRKEAGVVQGLIVNDDLAVIRERRLEEWRTGEIVRFDKTLKFVPRTFGLVPEGGRSLFISMHGGGNAPREVNDQQWRNQVKLYDPEGSLYIAPRAPTDTWNLWHEGHIDYLFDQLIEDAIAFGEVNPDRVYLMGYSAGGDGVYQLAPRMADRFAAAAMMAGHPNDASPLGLRNLPFAIHVGALDDGYGRNKVAEEWGKRLDELRGADAGGYTHVVKLHEGRGHWMNREDAEAVEWMKGFTRNIAPDRVVWQQSGGRLHDRFYWLSVPIEQAKAGQVVIASYAGQTVTIEKAEGISELTIWLRDGMVDLDQPVRVVMGEKVLFEGVVPRTIEAIDASFARRGDWLGWFEGRVKVSLRDGTSTAPIESTPVR